MPKIIETVSERALRSNRSLPIDLHHICIYIIFNALFIGFISKPCSRRLKSHEGSIAVERELLWVFVEFVDMLLCLSHESEQFELGGKAALQALQTELNLLDIL